MRRRLRFAVVVAVAVVAVVASSRRPDPVSPGAIAAADGFTVLPLRASEVGAFEDVFRANTGAVSASVVRMDPPPSSDSPTLVVVSMAFAEDVSDDGPRLVRRLASDIVIEPATETTIAGKRAFVHADDALFASSLLVVDGKRALVVYGGIMRDAKRAAEATLKRW